MMLLRGLEKVNDELLRVTPHLCRVLMLAKGTPIQKSFIVPILALQAPASIVSWIKYVFPPHYLMFHYTTGFG